MRSLPPLPVRSLAEVPSPNVVDPLGFGRDGAGRVAWSSGPLGPPLDPQPVFAPDALHELASHLPALAAQQVDQLAVAQARVPAGEHLDLSV